jgi:TRAP-type C4-dicarboxylate transport system permease small subunit
MMMLGTAVMFYRNSAMAFDLLLHNMPKKLRFWIEALIIMIIIAFAAYYRYQALILTIKVAGRFTSGVRVPLNFMYSSMFVSNLFVVLVMVEKFIDHLRGKTVLPEKEG